MNGNTDLIKICRFIDARVQQKLESQRREKLAALTQELNQLADAVEPLHSCWQDHGENRAVVDAHLPLWAGLKAKDEEHKLASRRLAALRRQADPAQAQNRAEAAALLLEDLIFPQVNQATREGRREVRIDLNDYRPRMRVTLAQTMRLRLRSSRLEGQCLVIDLPQPA